MIAPEIASRLQTQAAQAEANGHLTNGQLEIIYNHRWFKLFVPRCYGGLELTILEGLRVEEELARIDGSLGWTVTLCAGANLFVGYIQPSAAQTVFSDPQVCLGGSGQASGRAVMDNGGYRVSGKWHYATGAPHLTHFTANCLLEQSNGELLLDAEGKPVVRSFFFQKEEVRVVENWPAFGLKATASHSFELDEVWVDASRTFVIAPEQVTLSQPIYRYPFLQFAEATLAANTLGMARHFVACAQELLNDSVSERESRVGDRLAEARVSFYQAVNASWEELVAAGQVSSTGLQAVSDQSRALAHLCREEVMRLYPHAGLAAADASTEINRVWRDLFTGSQHSLLR